MGITEKFDEKRVLIWGYGAEGKSAERFLNSYCKAESVSVFEGNYADLKREEYDYIIKSPGVPYIYENDAKMTSLTELFLEEFGKNTIGITGTKGKSTTSSMLYKVLSDNLQRKVCLLGNIGIPSLDAYEEMKNGALAVYEMSCHQLCNNTVSPHVSIFLNLFEDHLDYYKTRDNYFKAKAHISLYQNKEDYLYAGKTVPYIDSLAKRIEIEDLFEEKYELSIPGLHNQQNADVVYQIASDIFGIKDDAIRKSLKEFKGLSHRLEKFVNIDGVDYYDDSISTIPEATINAISSVRNVKTVIVGGMDRGIVYDPLIEEIKKRKDITFILCYASGKRILEEIGEKLSNTIYCEELEEASKLAKKITTAGSCILSPAAASYGYFKNFEERGDVFKKYIIS